MPFSSWADPKKQRLTVASCWPCGGNWLRRCRPFLRWKINGVPQEIGLRTVEVEITADMDLEALYRRPRRLEPKQPIESDGDME